MQIGIISPTRYLKYCTTRLNLCYSTLLSNTTYLSFYKSLEGNVILDYSPKLPRKCNPFELSWGVEQLKPTYVVLPSVDYSSDRTISIVKDFLTLSRFKELIGVVQGTDLDSLSSCYKFLRGYSSIIGLPSPLETIARREEIVRDLGIKEKVLYIEVYANPYEEIPPPDSLGICTSLPLRLASDLRKLSEFSPTPPPLDFSKKDLLEELAKANIEEYLEAVRYEAIRR